MPSRAAITRLTALICERVSAPISSVTHRCDVLVDNAPRFRHQATRHMAILAMERPKRPPTPDSRHPAWIPSDRACSRRRGAELRSVTTRRTTGLSSSKTDRSTHGARSRRDHLLGWRYISYPSFTHPPPTRPPPSPSPSPSGRGFDTKKGISAAIFLLLIRLPRPTKLLMVTSHLIPHRAEPSTLTRYGRRRRSPFTARSTLRRLRRIPSTSLPPR